MAASSLRYNGATMRHETRTGAFVYDGTPSKFHEWEFRTMVKLASSDEERRLQSWSTIIDGLRREAARIAMTRHIKRGGKVWIRIFPDKPVSKKPAETRMGKGKGNPESWVARVKRGRILYEIEGVSEEVAHEALRLAAHKLPIRTKMVMREDRSS